MTTTAIDWHQQEWAELQQRRARIIRMEQALVDGDTREFLRICGEIDGDGSEGEGEEEGKEGIRY